MREKKNIIQLMGPEKKRVKDWQKEEKQKQQAILRAFHPESKDTPRKK